MIAAKLTVAAVQKLKPDLTRRREVPDGGCPGLRLRIMPTGHKSWAMRYKQNGKQVNLTLGTVDTVGKELDGKPVIGGHLTLVAARRLASEVQRQRALGRDHVAMKKAMRRHAADGGSDPMQLEQAIIEKSLSFIAQGIEPDCCLYRAYDPTGDLLYVGISLEPLSRLRKHKQGTAEWRHLVFRILIEPFATRKEALAAEDFAIKTEPPKFNVIHNGHRHPFLELAKLSDDKEKRSASS
ncbi:MAG TPA: integrase arm-type DNA-binding domain-containing protein [Methyloceanibacter sp.]|jgi:predicted GIY-YIG superfamily endonuclease|nr:integrase arm-type DNA-binding domain-containing protein [Methyloceanibacter sp.]